MSDPIACTLSSEEMSVRLVQLEELFAAHAVSAERGPHRLRLAFEGDDAVAARIHEAFDAERECCPFFSIAYARRGEHLVVDVDVPEAAGPALDVLRVLAERHLPRAATAR